MRHAVKTFNLIWSVCWRAGCKGSYFLSDLWNIDLINYKFGILYLLLPIHCMVAALTKQSLFLSQKKTLSAIPYSAVMVVAFFFFFFFTVVDFVPDFCIANICMHISYYWSIFSTHDILYTYCYLINHSISNAIFFFMNLLFKKTKTFVALE